MGVDINNKLLNELNASEKEAVLSILKEYKEKGTSQKFNELLYSDYREIPTDIETFITDDKYMGQAWKDNEGKLKIFPYWMEKLKELFPNNLETKVNNFIASGARGLGKAQPLDALVLTQYGYKEMGSLKVGDLIYGRDGNLYPILGLFPQGVRPIYKVSFSDGTSTECSDEHLWTVIDKRNDIPILKTLTINEILKCKYRTISKEGWANNYFEIPSCDPIKFEHKDNFISPYMMGCLLGDGCLGSLESNQCIDLSTDDEEIYNILQEELNSKGYKFSKGGTQCYNIVKQSRDCKPNIYKEEITRLNLLGKKSDTKFIPKNYLYNDVDSRVSLLQGLMDTDGEVSKTGDYVGFSTCSEQLAKDVVWLVQSLGGIATIIKKTNCTYHYVYDYKDKHTDEIRKCKNQFQISIRLSNGIIPFKLSRKRNRFKSFKKSRSNRKIVSIDRIEDKECQCLYLGSEEHLYLTNDFIVTHNTEVCILIMMYLLHRVMCLKNPLEHFRLKPTEKLVFALMNIKLDLAEEIAISKFQNSVKLSPWFMARGQLVGRTIKIWVPNDEYNIDIKIGSQADDVIGLPVYYAFFDEVSFQKNQDIDKQKAKAIDMIDTALGGMRTRFSYRGKLNALLCLASSKRSDKSFLETHIKDKLKSEPENVMIIDEPVWKVQPADRFAKEMFKLAVGNKFLVSTIIKDDEKVEDYILKGYNVIDVPVNLKSAFIDNMDRALCDYAGISSTELSKYISGAAVKDCLNESRLNPFVKEIIEVGNAKEDTLQYSNFFDLTRIPKELKSKPLFIHLDMSLSGDKTGIAGVWIKGKKPTTDGNPGKDLFYSLAFAVSIKAPKGRQISFEKNRIFIRWLKEQGFNIKEITSDTFQSADLQQQLSAEGFNCSLLSVDRVEATSRICIPYQYFKNTLYEQRIELFHDELLEQEIVNLERNVNTGKVDHPEGGSKDKVDAVCGSVFTASKYAEQYAYDYGEDLETLIDVNQDESEQTTKQLTVDLEEYLKNMGPVFGTPRDLYGKTEQEVDDEDDATIIDGALIW